MCLDSAHDNLPTYRLLEHWEINALIDLNKRRGTVDGLPEDVSLDKDGHPLCLAGFRMCSWGCDKNKGRKFRCPLASGQITECPCATEYSTSSHGRTVHIQNDYDLRFHPKIPRDSDQYHSIYKERTACERVNNRGGVNDYHLQDLKIRRDDHYAFSEYAFIWMHGTKTEHGRINCFKKSYKSIRTLIRIIYIRIKVLVRPFLGK